MSEQRHSLHESFFASGAMVLAVICALLGIATHLSNVGDPDPWFATAISFGVATAALVVDEKRLVYFPPDNVWEQRLERALIAFAVAVAVAGLVIGLVQDPDTNPLADVGVTLTLVSLAAALESNRQAVAGGRQVPFREQADVVSARTCAGLGVLLGAVGVGTSYARLEHSEAWLFASVVFAVLAVGFALDEHLELLHRRRDA